MTSRLSVVEKMAALREQGIDPFGKRFERTANSGQLTEKYSELDKEQLHELNETAIIAGRRNQTWKRKGWLCPPSRP